MIGLLAACLVGLVFGNLCLLRGLMWFVAQSKRGHEFNQKQLLQLSETAMQHLTARSLQEVVEAKSTKASADLQLGYLADTLAQGAAMKVAKEPKLAHTADGQVVNLNDFEMVDF